MTSPIPIILCGKIPSHQAAVPEAMKPEYEVLDKVFPTVSALADALPSLLPKNPAAIFMGGGFDAAEFAEGYALPGAKDIPWLRPLRWKPGNEHMLKDASGQAAPAPPAEKVAAGARGALDERVEILRERGGKGEIWYY